MWSLLISERTLLDWRLYLSISLSLLLLFIILYILLFLFISALVSLDSHSLLFLDLTVILGMQASAIARKRSFHFSQTMFISLVVNMESHGAFINRERNLSFKGSTVSMLHCMLVSSVGG